MWDQLTLDLYFDTMDTNQLQKGIDMSHEHYWDLPKNPTPGLNIVAECVCGEQVEEYTDNG